MIGTTHLAPQNAILMDLSFNPMNLIFMPHTLSGNGHMTISSGYFRTVKALAIEAVAMSEFVPLPHVVFRRAFNFNSRFSRLKRASSLHRQPCLESHNKD